MKPDKSISFILLVVCVLWTPVFVESVGAEEVISSPPEEDIWYPEAPYYHLKGQYESYLADKPEDADPPQISEDGVAKFTDLSLLKAKSDLAMYLLSNGFEGWTHVKVFEETAQRDPDECYGRLDQQQKALRLYEHIVKYYPEREYHAILAKAQMDGLILSLNHDSKGAIKLMTEVLAVRTADVIDSTDPRRNVPLPDAGGLTQAQSELERCIKLGSRPRVIELCRSLPLFEQIIYLGKIMEACAESDPESVRLADEAFQSAMADVARSDNDIQGLVE